MMDAQPPADRPPSEHEPAAPPPPPPPGPAGDYPLQVDVVRQAEYARLLPLVKWLLAIPHYLALIVLGIGAFVAIFVSFFAILITGRYPRALFDYIAGVYRWGWRVGAYVYLLTDRYPPFSLQDDPAFPARYRIEYPEQGVARWRPLVHWLLIIPYQFAATILLYLTYLMVLFGFFTILFTRRFPEGIYNIALVGLRWTMRANAYHAWLVPRYPPFVWG